jgi:hypothetical protein
MQTRARYNTYFTKHDTKLPNTVKEAIRFLKGISLQMFSRQVLEQVVTMQS